MTPEERAMCVTRLAELAPGADRLPFLTWLDERQEAALEELGANPGFDAVRAGIVRALADRIPADVLRPALEAAWAALSAYDGAADADLAFFVQREPSWVGLCTLELAAAAPDLVPEPLITARGLARSGFARMGGGDIGDGEVLWAIAEKALDIGWVDRAIPLFEAAEAALFADPENRDRVRSVIAGMYLERDQELLALPWLRAVTASELADGPTRIQALVNLAMLLPDEREDRLREALDEANLEGDADIAAKITEWLS